MFFQVLAYECSACTAVVISGKATASGRPMMLKVRDSQEQNADFLHVTSFKYDFFAQTTKSGKDPSEIKGAVSGCNSAGLCMASLTPGKGFAYDSMRDKRLSGGKLIFRALGNCRNISEFEEMVYEIFKSRIIIAHIVAIDAEGGAAVYEFGGKTFVKYDANDFKTCPGGFRCQTNFSFSGDPALGAGQKRYDAAVRIMESLPRNAEGKFEFGPVELSDYFCRSFVNTDRKINGLDGIGKKYFPGDDFIIRSRSCIITTYEGVKPGENPKHTILWAQLGTPTCTPAVPMLLSSEVVPEYMKGSKLDSAAMLKTAMHIRNTRIYDLEGEKRFDKFNVNACREIIPVVRKIEAGIQAAFHPLFEKWRNGEIQDTVFLESYISLLPCFYEIYRKDFAGYLQ